MIKIKVGYNKIFSRVNWEEFYGSIKLAAQESLTIFDGEWWTTDRHVYFYAGLIACLVFFVVCRSFAFYQMCLRISTNLHNELFRGVTRATMIFFHQNSTGRFLNRFSKDLGAIDSTLPVIIADCLEVSAIYQYEYLSNWNPQVVFPRACWNRDNRCDHQLLVADSNTSHGNNVFRVEKSVSDNSSKR